MIGQMTPRRRTAGSADTQRLSNWHGLSGLVPVVTTATRIHVLKARSPRHAGEAGDLRAFDEPSKPGCESALGFTRIVDTMPPVPKLTYPD